MDGMACGNLSVYRTANEPLRQTPARRVRSRVGWCRDAAGCARGSMAPRVLAQTGHIKPLARGSGLPRESRAHQGPI
jgi:hypothetical protein